MAIGISVGDSYYCIGGSDFFHSFFSTISYHLEPNGWGTAYPLLTQDLYRGKLEWQKANEALSNLNSIKNALRAFEPSKVIWDIHNLHASPPWGDHISPEIVDLSNYFVTSDGEDMFEVLTLAFENSNLNKNDVVVE